MEKKYYKVSVKWTVEGCYFVEALNQFEAERAVLNGDGNYAKFPKPNKNRDDLSIIETIEYESPANGA